MQIDITYKEAKKRYPVHVKEALARVAKSKNKYKHTHPELMHWCFDWCVRLEGGINGGDFLKMVAGEKPFPEHKKPSSEDAEADDYFRRATITLAVRLGNTTYTSAGKVTDQPKEIGDFIRKSFRDDAAEAARIAKLTPEEREAESNEILGQLRRSPGFVEMTIPRTPKPGRM